MSGLSPEQKERRRSGIGASEIAALIGVSKWATPIQIWEAKVRGLELDATYAMDLGNEFESPIARVWAKRNKRLISIVDTLQHPDPAFKFAMATPDRAVFLTKEAQGDGRKKKQRHELDAAEKLLQVKSTNWRLKYLWGEEGTDSIPMEYVAASHWEGAVAGQAQVDFAVDFDKTKLSTFTVMVDLGVFASMYAVAERFMIDHVLAGVPPPPDFSERYEEFLTRQFPRAGTSERDIEQVDPSEEALLQTVALFAKLKTAEKRMKVITQQCRNLIITRIGGARGIKGDFGKITWNKNKDGQKTDWRAVADESMRIAALVVQTMPEGDHRAALAEDLRKLIETNTQPTFGAHVLRSTWAGPLKFEAEAIDLKLEEIQEGLTGEATPEQADAAAAEQR